LKAFQPSLFQRPKIARTLVDQLLKRVAKRSQAGIPHSSSSFTDRLAGLQRFFHATDDAATFQKAPKRAIHRFLK
jgi:hypothetical protein